MPTGSTGSHLLPHPGELHLMEGSERKEARKTCSHFCLLQAATSGAGSLAVFLLQLQMEIILTHISD